MPLVLVRTQLMCYLLNGLLLLSFFFNDTATTEIYTLSLHDALPISRPVPRSPRRSRRAVRRFAWAERSEEHTSELQSPDHLVCRLLLEKKKSPRSWATGSSDEHSTRYTLLSDSLLTIACHF